MRSRTKLSKASDSPGETRPRFAAKTRPQSKGASDSPLAPTLVLAAVFLAVTALFGWLGARPARPNAGPRLVPWRFLMLLAFLGVVFTLGHALAMLRGR